MREHDQERTDPGISTAPSESETAGRLPATELAKLPNWLMRASAGTGKTFQLSNRYLSLIANDQYPSRILAATFTRKAAGEILERIVLRLAAAAHDEAECARLDGFLGDEAQLNSSRVAAMLTGLLERLHRVRVGTLDSFFAHLARSFSLEMGLPPGWKIVEPIDDEALRDEAITQVLREEDAGRIVHLLAKGESRRGVAELVQTTVDQLHAVYRETSESAWTTIEPVNLPSTADVQQALDQIAAYRSDKTVIQKAATEDRERFATEEWELFLERGLAKPIRLGQEAYRRVALPNELMDAYRVLIDYARGKLVNEIALQTRGTLELLRSYDQHLTRLKRSRGEFRFQDVNYLVDRSLREQTTRHIAFRQGDAIDHLLLDEFQDTAPQQWAVVRRFAERTVEPLPSRSFFCVGDTKQAIYGWRGGEAEIFETVDRHLQGIQHAPSMNLSRRSSRAVIATVNRLFTGMLSHPKLEAYEAGIKKWCEQFEIHETTRDREGYARLECSADEDGIACAAQRVAEIHNARPDLSIAVLTRTNVSINAVIRALNALGVAASEEGGNPLTDCAAVQVIMSLLRFADHPADRVSLFHVATSPLGQTMGLPSQHDQIAALAPESAGALASQIRNSLVNDGYAATVDRWVSELATWGSARDQLRLDQLRELAIEWDQRPTLRPTRFVTAIEQARVSDPSSARVRVMTIHQAKGLEFDMVVLVDLDKSFAGKTPTVVVHRPDPGEPPDGVIRYRNTTIQSLLPKRVQGWFDDARRRDMAEMLCVLYVAATRAREALYLMVPTKPAEKSLPKSASGLLRAALAEGVVAAEPGILFECGKEEWYLDCNDESVRSRPEDKSDAGPAPGVIRLRHASGQTGRSLELASPSGQEHGQSVRLGEAWRDASPHGAAFGTLVHKWFEQIEWLEDGVPGHEQLRMLAKSTLTNHSAIDDAIERFRQFLTLDCVTDSLTRHGVRTLRASAMPARWIGQMRGRNHEISVQNEYRYACRINDRLWQGSIDRLLLYRENDRVIGAEVIDYKTDQLSGPEDSMTRLVAVYRPQMEAYLAAVRSIFGLHSSSVGGRLIFLSLNQTITIEEASKN